MKGEGGEKGAQPATAARIYIQHSGNHFCNIDASTHAHARRTTPKTKCHSSAAAVQVDLLAHAFLFLWRRLRQPALSTVPSCKPTCN